MRLLLRIFCLAFMPGAGVAVAASNAVVQATVSMDFSHKVITEDPTRGREFSIRNSESDPLVFTGAGVTITGPDADDFVITKMPSLEPQGNQTTSIRFGEVAFAPKSIGSKVANLTVTTNDPDDPEINLPIMGLGLLDRGTTITGPYTGFGPGISTIGPGGDYTSLADACTSLSATPLTGGDWTFQILGDLTETRNSAIAQPDTNGHHAIFRPAPGVDATVTFSDTSTVNPRGHFLIGNKPYVGGPSPGGPSSTGIHTPTDGIIMDGTGRDGASSQALTLTNNTTTTLRSLVLVYGDSDNTTIRNCILESKSDLQFSNPAIFFAADGGLLLDDLAIPPAVADGCIVENCKIITSGSKSINAIAHDAYSLYYTAPTNYAASFPKIPGLVVRNNVFQTNGTVLSVATARHVELSSNTISYMVPQEQANVVFTPNIIEIGTRYNRDLPGHVEVVGNQISVTGAADSAVDFSAISIGGTNTSSTCLIANNIISGITAAATDPYNPKTRAAIVVRSGSESTATIVHNSIYMPASDNLPGWAGAFGIGAGANGWPGDIVIANNSISMNVTNGNALQRHTNAGRFLSDHNNIYVSDGSNVGLWRGTILPDLADWQTSTGQDMNSISVNPFEPVAPGLGTWTRAAEAGEDGPAVADLHFRNYPGSVYLAPKIDGLETDIDGDIRSEEMVIMGADEVPHHRSVVNGWGIY